MNNLPEGYRFVERQSILVPEILAVRNSVGWTSGEDEFNTWLECLERSIVVCGVRDEKGALAGIGFVAGNSTHQWLSFSCQAVPSRLSNWQSRL